MKNRIWNSWFSESHVLLDMDKPEGEQNVAEILLVDNLDGTSSYRWSILGSDFSGSAMAEYYSIQDIIKTVERAYDRFLEESAPGYVKKVRRYISRIDDDGEYVCDKVWIDRTTGEEVLRYDLGDPANWNPDYGAETDEETFYNRGRDIDEMIPENDCV